MRVGRRPRGNPFSTRFVRPGAIPYRFADGTDAAAVVTRLERQGWWGQIVGPHGSGKSTLLATLLPELRRRRAVVTVELHADRRRFPDLAGGPDSTLLAVDGYEQLSWWTRRRVQRYCRRWGWGLLVTAHGDPGLPALLRTGVTPALARTLVEGLLTEKQREMFAKVDLAQGLARHHGSLREILFELYVLFEAGAPGP
jgi:hypothetical protein